MNDYAAGRPMVPARSIQELILYDVSTKLCTVSQSQIQLQPRGRWRGDR